MIAGLAAILMSFGLAGVERTEVRLLETVRTEPSMALEIADIARVSGPDAATVGSIELIESVASLPLGPSGWRTVEASMVEAALRASDVINMGRVSLVGAGVHVREVGVGPLSDQGHARKTRTRRTDERTDDTPVPISDAPGSYGERVLRALESTLRVRAEHLRVTAEAETAAMLDAPVGGLVVSVRPTAIGPRTPISITTYNGERITDRKTVRVHVEVRRRCAVTSRDIRRDEAIADDDLSIDARWLDPTLTPAEPGEIAGEVARRGLAAGSVIETADIEPPVVIERGDVVVLHSVTSSVVITRHGRALESARDGELVLVEVEGRESRLQGRASGPGNVVIRDRTGPASRGPE